VSHLDPEVLSLLALGEPADDPLTGAHLAGCDRCRDELESLRHVVAAGRAVTDDDVIAAPPARVWAAIAADTGVSRAPSPASSAPVVELAPRRRSRLVAVAAAAAVLGVLAGAAGTLLIGAARSGQGTEVVASSSLSPVAVPGMAGQAVLAQDAVGRTVDVDISGVPDAARTEGFLEVWLLDPRTGRMVALGSLDSRDRGTFVVPPGVDLGQFDTVDVSLEPFDGDPGHSTNSMLRARLAT